MAADLGRNMYIRQRDGIYNPLMLADSGLEEECYHSLNWVMAGKAKQKHNGGSEMGKYPHVGLKGRSACHSDK